MRLWRTKPIPSTAVKPSPQEDDLLGHPLYIAINNYEYRIGPASRPKGRPGMDLKWRGLCTPKEEKCSMRVLGAIAFLDDREAEDWDDHPFKAGDVMFYESEPRSEAWRSVTIRVNLASQNEVLRAFQTGFGCGGTGHVGLSVDVDRLSDDEQKSLDDSELHGSGKRWLRIRSYTLTSAGWMSE